MLPCKFVVGLGPVCDVRLALRHVLGPKRPPSIVCQGSTDWHQGRTVGPSPPKRIRCIGYFEVKVLLQPASYDAFVHTYPKAKAPTHRHHQGI